MTKKLRGPYNKDHLKQITFFKNDFNQFTVMSIVPATILSNKNLSSDEKLIFGVILSSANEEGKLYFTNEDFMQALIWKSDRVVNSLKKLADLGFISRKTMYGGYTPLREIQVLS